VLYNKEFNTQALLRYFLQLNFILPSIFDGDEEIILDDWSLSHYTDMAMLTASYLKNSSDSRHMTNNIHHKLDSNQRKLTS
jgi:hypothetical protein